MLEEDIQTILSYCSFRIDYFYVSRTFEKIYTEIVYTDEIADKLFLIAAYEQDQVSIDMLKDRNLILFEEDKEQKLINYWKNCEPKEFIDANLKLFSTKDCINSHFVTYKELFYDKDIPTDNDGRKFAIRLLDQFNRLSKRFKKHSDYLYLYKSYCIRHEIVVTANSIKTFIIFLDYKFENFLLFVCTNQYTVYVLCNRFKILFHIDNCNHCNQQSENVADYISNAYTYLTLPAIDNFKDYISDDSGSEDSGSEDW